MRSHRDIKLLKTNKRRNELISEPNNHTTKYLSEKLLADETSKEQMIKFIQANVYGSSNFRHMEDMNDYCLIIGQTI